MTVREVAHALNVCRATVYRLVDEQLLARVWVDASIRIPAESVERLLTDGRQR